MFTAEETTLLAELLVRNRADCASQAAFTRTIRGPNDPIVGQHHARIARIDALLEKLVEKQQVAA